MRTITKHLATIKAAERYQNRLYGKYDTVRLIDFPRFSESGNYTWEVATAPNWQARQDNWHVQPV